MENKIRPHFLIFHPLSEKDDQFKEMLQDCLKFYEEIKYSGILNKSSIARNREEHDKMFYDTLLELLQQLTKLHDVSERNLKVSVRMLHKWWKQNRAILHRNLSQLENLIQNSNSKLRVPKDVLKRSRDAQEGLKLAPLDIFATSEEKISSEATKSVDVDEQFSEDVLQSSLLNLPQDDENNSLLGTPDSAADMTPRSYRDDKEVLIPGASKPFVLSMPAATPLEQPPLKNLKNIFNSEHSMGQLGTKNRKGGMDKTTQMDPGEIWNQFLKRQRAEEEFATLSEFYGRHGTAYTKRYSSHARSWGPEESTKHVIDSYAQSSPSHRLPYKVKDQIIYQNLEDFQEFEKEMSEQRRMSKSAAGERKRTNSPVSGRRLTSRQIRGGKFRSVDVNSANLGHHDYSTRKSVDNGASDTGDLNLTDVIHGACSELVINKEHVGPEPSRGFRQPFKPINPYKTIASQTITLTKNRPETAVSLEPPILLIPGLSSSVKRKDPDEVKEQFDPMTPRVMPGQRQSLKSAGGATARGNRPYTSMPRISSKDKWANHQPSDENRRVKGAANHPFFSMNKNVVEKLVMVNHLGQMRSTPWWKQMYPISPATLFLDTNSAKSRIRGDSSGRAEEVDPTISYVPNIASKKNIYVWTDADLETEVDSP